MYDIGITMKSDIGDETLIKCGFVKIAPYRLKIVKSLKGGQNKIPTQLAKENGIRTNHISKALSDLKAKGIVVCINEEARKGRIYRLTEEGEIIARSLED